MTEQKEERSSSASKTCQIENEECHSMADQEMPIIVQRGVILMNIIVISIAFMILFAAFHSLAFLQSSINKVTYILSLGDIQITWDTFLALF